MIPTMDYNTRSAVNKMDGLVEFLEERDIAKEDIQRMITNKVDCSVIVLMTDEQLEDYIPLYGDRLAIRDFCRRHDRKGESKAEQKKSLLSKIKNRLLLKKTPRNEEYGSASNFSKNIGNKSATRTTRRIELGWINSDKNGKNKQVREKTGGGTRHLTVAKSTNMMELLEIAKSLFFPDRVSVRGSVDDFIITLVDFQLKPVTRFSTVEENHNRSKLRILRYYIHTERKEVISDLGESTSLSSLPSLDSDTSNRDDESYPVTFEREEIVQTSSNDEVLENPFEQFQPHTENQNISIGSDPEIQFVRREIGGASALDASLDSTLPYITADDTENRSIQSSVKLRIHRGHSLKEMIQQFCDPDVVNANLFDVTMVLPNGQEEHASGDGVFRDCISGFWTEFTDQCCLGNQKKIPVIRHDFQSDEWTAVARIILKGYELLKYFPTFLSASVIEEALYGDHTSSLLDNFLDYVTDGEKQLFIGALENFDLADKDELLDALENHNCRSIVTKDTLRHILLEVAHKELIQEPRYIINCWAKVLEDLGSKISRQQLREMYNEMEPTVRKVLKLLQFPENMTAMELEVANHLKRYIREMDQQALKKFLRFCTGSDLIIMDFNKINVEFANMVGFMRRPIGRTCGRVLELPRSYESFAVFRNEFKSVLSSDIWLMDIV